MKYHFPGLLFLSRSLDTVEVMIMSRYRYRPVTVTDRYRSLPNFTVTCVTTVTPVTDRNKGPSEQIFKVL